jgi:hypothetical protein
MTDAVALRPARTVPRAVTLLLIPIAAAVAGLLIRYFAYAATVDGATLARFATGLCRWDCAWYVRLAEIGYDGFPTPRLINAGNWAFFPAYPMLIGALVKLTGLPTMLVATATSIALSVAAVRVAWPLLGRNLAAYTLFAVFLLAGPFSIYFTTFYTEVLFLFLAICVFVALQQRRWLLAGLFAAALSATRIVGVFIVFAILVEAWLDHRGRGGTWRDFVPSVFRRPDLLLSFAIAPLGLFAYMAFLHFKVGDALAFQHVQRAWARPFGLPPLFVWNALTSAPKEGFMPTSSQVLGLATIAGYLLSIALLWKRRFGMATFSLIALTLPLFAGVASVLRFVAGLAPMPLMLCELLAKNRIVAGIGLLLMLAGCWYGTVGWLTGYLALV